MRAARTKSCRRIQHQIRPKLRLLVCTANLGNEQPDPESIAKWIPPDGHFVDESAKATASSSTTGTIAEDESEEVSFDHSVIPYETKYPIRYSDVDCTALYEDEFDLKNSISKQLDLIVIGLQEATFDPPKIEGGDGAESIRVSVPIVKPFRKLKTLRAAKDFSAANEKSLFSDPGQPIRDLSTSTAPVSPSLSAMSTSVLRTFKRNEWNDGTHVLHSLFEARLPSFERLVSYQRGQMRLLVFARTQSSDPIHDPPLPMEVIHTAAQNTGRAGLANKGGIVTEILVNSGTRLSFMSCHLEAHEGASKYATRCQTVGDILRGTAARKKGVDAAVLEKNNPSDNETSGHHVTPTAQSRSSRSTSPDISLTAHYSFVMGDLNFRTDLSLTHPELADSEEEHKQAVRDMVAKGDWDSLNEADELNRALRNKECLVGFQTLHCNFPPTFKLERQAGYEYVEKRRPSYTDRILFKTGHELDRGVSPLLYEPIDEFTTSDHKPVRGAFTVNLNPTFRVRPRTVRHESVRWNRFADRISGNGHERGSRFRKIMKKLAHPRQETDPDDSISVSSNVSVVDLSHGQGHGNTGELLQLFVSNISVVLKGSESSYNLSLSAPNPYLMLMSEPEEALRLPWARDRKWKRILARMRLRSSSFSERTKDGWPCTSRKSNTYTASWNEEEICCKVATHSPSGGSLDLTGAMLLLNVMNAGTDDSLLGTVSFNLANLLESSTRSRGLVRGRSACTTGSNSSNLCHRRVRRRSVLGFGTSIVGRSQNQLGENRVGSMRFSNQNVPQGDADEDEDPVAAVDVREPLLRGGVEVGLLTCTIEAWWMNEATAKIVRVPDTNTHETEGENHHHVMFKRFRKPDKPEPRFKAEKRGAIRQYNEGIEQTH